MAYITGIIGSATDPVTKPEHGSTFPTLWPPSWKINMTS